MTFDSKPGIPFVVIVIINVIIIGIEKAPDRSNRSVGLFRPYIQLLLACELQQWSANLYTLVF